MKDMLAWISGIRRDQSATRAATELEQWNTRHGLLKLNPLAFWTEREVWAYIFAHEVPYNPLLDRGYPHDYRAIYGARAGKRGPLNPHGSGAYDYFDAEWHPYAHGSDLHTLQSATKSMASTVWGVAITRGDFKASLDTPVLHYFGERKVSMRA